MTAPWLAIVGIGEDGHLPPAARAAVAGARLVAGGRRHLALAEAAITGARLPWPTPMADAYPAILARRGTPVAVLASGDPFCFGVGAALARLVPTAEITCHPAPSAFALARARLGWPVTEVAELSALRAPARRGRAASASGRAAAGAVGRRDHAGMPGPRLLRDRGPRRVRADGAGGDGRPGGAHPDDDGRGLRVWRTSTRSTRWR